MSDELDMGTTDKRVLARRRTKNMIYDALFDYLKERPLSSITITDLITKSGVARSTFYRHFGSVSEVFDGYIHCLDERLDDAIDSIPIDFKSRTYLTKVFELYQSLDERLPIIHAAGLSGRFIQNITDYHLDHLGDMPSNSPDRYYLHYYAGAIYCVAAEWIASGMKETPEELADIFLSI